MPACYLQVYENLEKSSKNKEYWREYTSFYESYWGGPTSPYGIWFGSEYENFEKSLADHLNMEIKDLKQCLFIKENDEYYICPSDLNENKQNYSFLVNNLVPIHWLMLFNENQKKVFKTHWGFGAIHYTSTIIDSLSSINEFFNLNINQNKNEKFTENFKNILADLKDTENWLTGFDKDSILILNFGDLLANLPQNSLDKEDSVSILNDIKELIKEESYNEAEKVFNFLIERWSKIEFVNQKNESNLDN